MAVFELSVSILAVCAFLPSGAPALGFIDAPMHFYPYGCQEDKVVLPNDDGHSGQISLSCSIRFYQKMYPCLFVSIRS